MSRGRPRHQSSRRRMYSPRLGEVRERRIHQQVEEHQAALDVPTVETDDGQEFESPSWGIRVSARASAA